MRHSPERRARLPCLLLACAGVVLAWAAPGALAQPPSTGTAPAGGTSDAEGPAGAATAPAPPPSGISSTARPTSGRAPAGTAGRPAATFALRRSLSLAEEYTDNFRLVEEDGQENFRTTVSAGLGLLINHVFAKGEINGGLSAAYDSATDSGQLNLFPSLQGEVSRQVSPRLRLTASDQLVRSDEPALADVLSLRRERRTFTSNVFSLVSDYRLHTVATRQSYNLTTFFDEDGVDTISHALGLSAGTRIYRTNSGTVAYEYLLSHTDAHETTGHQVSASLSRRLNARSSAGLAGSYAIRTTSGGAGSDGEFTIWSLSLFTAHTMPGRWTISSSLGLSQLQNDRGAGTTSVTTATTLSYQFARASASLAIEQGFSETFVHGQNFGVVETRGARGSLSFPVTPFVTGTAGAFYRQNDFTGIGEGPAERTEDSWGATLGFSIRLHRALTLTVDSGHTAWMRSHPGGLVTENRARAALGISF